jgi:regulation of enolase protein 1 (concanavalin A-like superfamily)
MASGLFRVRSVGTNMAGAADSFHFVYRPCDGDCEIMARVVNVQPRFASKAGVMIREKLTSDSVNVFYGLSENRGMVQHRDVNGGETEIDPTPQTLVSTWLRLKRTGNQFTASSSREGMSWTRYASMTVPMSEHVWIGLAASAGQPQIAGVATIDNVAQDVVVPHTSFTPQIHLQSGSVISGPILAGDDNEFSLASFPFSVPASTVSYLLFRWLPYRFSSQVSGGTPGVLLTSGQFVQGSLSRLQREMLGLSSVLFGLQSIDTDSEVYALVLRRSALEVPSRYMVLTENG